jgi:NADPH:quinone reductase-like Zn-dependent oxidoreductase
MRALAVLTRGAAPAVIDLKTPEPGPDQVRVAVRAASINGFDLAVAGGYLWDRLPHRFPVILGRDYAGTVEAVGTQDRQTGGVSGVSGVSGVAVGDRVAGVNTAMELGPGPIAEAFVVAADTLTAVPAGLSDAQAAALGLAGITAFDAITELALTTRDTVLVVGAAGGVGSFAVQLAAATGARVIGTARPGPATDFVRGLGAAEVIDYTGDLAAAVRAVAADGVSAVLHAAGDPTASATALAPGGRFVSVLGATSEQIGRDDITTTAVMATYAPRKLATLLAKVATGELTVSIAGSYALADAPAALAAFGEGKLGKIVITTP